MFIFFLLLKKSFTPLLKAASLEKTIKNILLFVFLIGIFALIIMVGFIFLNNKIKCKYDLNKIKEQNEDNFNNDNLSITGENECTKLDLDKCYSLEDLQPCLNQLKNTIDEHNKIEGSNCTYCLDYSYDDKDCSKFINEHECSLNEISCEIQNKSDGTTFEKCINKTCNDLYNENDKECKNDNRCKWDEQNKQCSNKEINNSKRLCLEEENMNYKDNTELCKTYDKNKCEEETKCSYVGNECMPYTSIKCKSKDYCNKEIRC